MIKLKVKKINNVGQFGEYPAMRNVETGRIYVDICLGIPKELEHGPDGYNKHCDYVGFNIPGAWATFHIEPECPLKKEIEFELV